MGEGDSDGSGLGLGLSLGLGSFTENRSSNDSPPAPAPAPIAAPTPAFPLNLFKPPYFRQRNDKSHGFFRDFRAPSSADLNKEPRSVLRGIDVNQQPITVVIDCEEENAVVSSPNSTVSTTSLSGKRSEREDRDDVESLDADEDDGDAAGRKKLRLSKEQAVVLEETFKEHSTLNPKQKLALAKQLNLRPRQVEVWFQNRRARTKLKQTEVDCEYLRRCCENLTEENRRLQREVSELRALKLSPQFYSNMKPPTTLTMCPQCERVAVSSSSSLSSTAAAAGQPPEAAAREWWR